MSDELDLDAGITFCGSWDPDDCAFTTDGAPIVWACGFHSLVTELRELRESLAASKASTAKARTRAANAEAQRDDALAASTRLAARVNRGEPVVILGKRYIHVPSQPTSSDHPSVTRPDVVEILAAMREDASSVRNRGRITAGNVLILCSEVERLRNALQRIRDLPAYQTPDVAWGIADEALEP